MVTCTVNQDELKYLDQIRDILTNGKVDSLITLLALPHLSRKGQIELASELFLSSECNRDTVYVTVSKVSTFCIVQVQEQSLF